jgi:hypothetical protein
VIFNTLAYYLLFLCLAALTFRLVRPAWRPQVCVAFGAAFFIFFSLTAVGGIAGACCLAISCGNRPSAGSGRLHPPATDDGPRSIVSRLWALGIGVTV